MKFLPVCEPTVTTADERAVVEAMRSKWLSTGQRVSAFETALQQETQYRHAVAMGSCTAALFLALKALGVGGGDRVVVPALTFAATANVVEQLGATIELVDVDPETWQLDWTRVLEIKTRVRAVVPVHLYGQPYPDTALRAFHHAGLLVVEDAAHSIGAKFSTESDAACVSFYATKNITTLGEGGAVLTGSGDLAARLRRLRLHGLDADAWQRYGAGGMPVHQVVEAGYKTNMTDVAAAMGLTQLARLEAWREQRERLAAIYDRELNLPRPARTEKGVAHLYPILLPEGLDRMTVVRELRDQGIGTGIHYRALPTEPHYERFANDGRWPVAEMIGERCLSLPLYPHLRQAEIDRVITAVHKVLA